jgi:signal-transduction protein with cAMP-binding, CBS, and nucleotidyltransferase domain
VVLILNDEHDRERALDVFARVCQSRGDCGYLPAPDLSFEPSFCVASVSEWKKRFHDWVRDPILQQMYRARPLFDLWPVEGRHALWQEVEAVVNDAVDREFLYVLANDCLASLPPLTFFEDGAGSWSMSRTA